MSGITELGTTYNLPNYTGLLFQLSPMSTPFFSAIGGLNGGGQIDGWEMEWQASDLRSAGQNVALEGAAAPTAQERVRSNVTNVTQIQQEKVSVSYTKQASTGMKAGSNNDLPNPVGDELSWQVRQRLAEMKRDINFSFVQGTYHKPSDNTTARRTRGLLAAISTNAVEKSTASSTGLSASTDTITETATGRSNGDKIIIASTSTLSADSQVVLGRVYYVVSKSTNSFKIATTSTGTGITVGTSTIDYRVPWTTTLDTTLINNLLAMAYDNGGIDDPITATLLCNSAQKMAVTAAYMSAYGKYMEQSRTVGGVAVDTIVTDFGTLGVMLDRTVPQDTLAVASLNQCQPVFTEVPGKGHFFAEPLARTGASEDVQLYGEVGLAYGNETAHAKITGLAV